MRSYKEIARKEQANGDISLRQLAREHKVNTVRQFMVSHEMRNFHRRTGGEFGPLAKETNAPLQRTPEGQYVRQCQTGRIEMRADGGLQAYSDYEVLVNVAAVHCIGTDDPGGVDEPYLIASLISVNPSASGESDLVKTTLVSAQHVEAGNVFGEGTPLGKIVPAGGEVKIHLALFEEQHGKKEDIARDIEGHLREAVRIGAATIGGAVGAGDINTAGLAGEALNNKLVRSVTLGISKWLADSLADDFLGEKTYLVDYDDLTKWYGQDEIMTDEALPPGTTFRLPKHHLSEHWLFDKEGATYRVYLSVRVLKVSNGVRPA